MHRAGVTHALSGSLGEDADSVAVLQGPPRHPQRVAIALAPAHREGAGPAEELAGDRHPEQLDLRHEVERATDCRPTTTGSISEKWFTATTRAPFAGIRSRP
jgi:hypothetical protein